MPLHEKPTKRGRPSIANTEQQRREIREAVRFGYLTLKEIAVQYGFRDGSGPLRLAQAYERSKGLIPDQHEKAPVPDTNAGH